MKLVSISLVRNEEHWIWYSLTSVHPHVDEILVFDNGSRDRTVEIVRDMEHIRDKLTFFEGNCVTPVGTQQALEVAAQAGATHALILDGYEVHADTVLAACRRVLETSPEQGIALGQFCPARSGPDSCFPEARSGICGGPGLPRLAPLSPGPAAPLLRLPELWLFDFAGHCRSSQRETPGEELPSVPMHHLVHTPGALLRADGPGNPTLWAWGSATLRSGC